MRIGIMLRTLRERGGIAVYSRYITEELLTLDRTNEYVLFYQDRGHLGSFAHHEHARERVLPSKSKVLWDQVLVPAACRREQIDMLLHPKFTVPLAAPCPTVMVLHGAGWLIPEHARFWSRADVAYIKLAMQLYLRKAAAVISVSERTTEVFGDRYPFARPKLRTVYFAPGKQFARVVDESVLEAVRAKYQLPRRFVFTLSKRHGGERKNVKGILEAYALFHGSTEHKLVIGGKDCSEFRSIYNIPEHGYGGDVLFPGWIEQRDLPAVYSLADLFLYPSNLEAFPIPVTEAMACGTPVITSDANGLREIAGQGALFVSAHDPRASADAMRRVLTDESCRAALGARALERAKSFSWERCARETLAIIEGAAR